MKAYMYKQAFMHMHMQACMFMQAFMHMHMQALSGHLKFHTPTRPTTWHAMYVHAPLCMCMHACACALLCMCMHACACALRRQALD